MSITPISYQPMFAPAKPAQSSGGSAPNAGETAFVFNFNSPAIAHNEAAAANANQAKLSNGIGSGGNQAPDFFQKQNNAPVTAPAEANPSQGAFANFLASQPPANVSDGPANNTSKSEVASQSAPPNPFSSAANALPPVNPAAPVSFQAPAPPTTPTEPAPQQASPATPAFDPAAQQQQLLQQIAQQQPQMNPYQQPQFMPQQPQMDPFQQQMMMPPQQQQPSFAQEGIQQAPPSYPQAMQMPMQQPATFPMMQPMFPPPPTYAQAMQPMPQAYPQQPAYPQPMEQQPPAYPMPPEYGQVQGYGTTPISDLNTMIAQPKTPDEKLAAINEIANRQQGDRQTYELLKQEISNPMQGVPPEAATAIRQAALIALGSLNGSPINARYAGHELYGMGGIDKILSDKNENPLVKASAVAALGYMNRPQDKTIQAELRKAAKDPNPDVKNAVAQVQAGQMIGPSQTPQAAQ